MSRSPRSGRAGARVGARSRSASSALSIVNRAPVTLPFTDNFNRSNGPVGSPWTDIYSYLPDTHEPMGIVSNALAEVLHRGDNYGQGELVTGWRGGIVTDCGITNNISVAATLLTSATDVDAHGGPLVGFTMGDDGLFVGGFYNTIYGYVELATQGKAADGAQYLDSNWCDPLTGDPVFTLRVVDNEVALYVDGDLYCFAALPAAHQGISIVGVSTDDGDNDTPVNTPTIDSVTISEDATAISDYSVPSPASASHIGSTVKVSSGTTVDVPYPAAVDAGDLLVMFVMNESSRTHATPAGWTEVMDDGLFTQIAMFRKVATGSESGSETVTFSGTVTGGGGVMLSIGGVSSAKPNNGYTDGLVVNDTTLTMEAEDVLGRNRLGLLFTASNAEVTHTHPAGWTPLAVSSVGGATVSFKLSATTISIDNGSLEDSEHWKHWPEETITLSASSIAAGIRIQIMPQTF